MGVALLAVMQAPLNLILAHLSIEEGFGEVQNTSLEVDHRRKHFCGQAICNLKALNEQMTKRQIHTNANLRNYLLYA